MQEGQYASVGVANATTPFVDSTPTASGFNDKGWAIDSRSHLSMGQPWIRRGNLLQCPLLLLRCSEEVDERSLPELLYLGQPVPNEAPRELLPTRLTGSRTTTTTTLTGVIRTATSANSRVVNDFSPSAIATWDWDINDQIEAHHFCVWQVLYVQEHQAQLQQRREPTARLLEEYAIGQLLCMGRLQNGNNMYTWKTGTTPVNYWQASKQNRQMNWTACTMPTSRQPRTGQDLLYYVQAKHNQQPDPEPVVRAEHQADQEIEPGYGYHARKEYQPALSDTGRHAGGAIFHNINTYALAIILRPTHVCSTT